MAEKTLDTLIHDQLENNGKFILVVTDNEEEYTGYGHIDLMEKTIG